MPWYLKLKKNAHVTRRQRKDDKVLASRLERSEPVIHRLFWVLGFVGGYYGSCGWLMGLDASN